ncbi:MAG: glycosyltransferase, partial [Eubacterium sp.]|nr:glycosyltransferase [Eubacterium sp.]
MSKVSIIVPYLKGPAYLRECVESVMSQGLDDYEIIIADDRDGHEVPEDVLAIPQVKHVVLDDELDVDEFFEAKAKFFDEKKRIKLGLTEEEWEQRKIQKAAAKAAMEESEKLRQLEEEEENELNGGGDDASGTEDEQEQDSDDDIVLRPYGVATARNMGVKHATGDYIYFLDGDDYLYEGCLKGLLKVAEEKNAKVVTGNRTDTWFKPISFDFEKSKPDSEVKGIVPLEGETLIEIMYKRVTVQNLLV